MAGATCRAIHVHCTTDGIRMNPPGKVPEIDIHDLLGKIRKLLRHCPQAASFGRIDA